MVWGSVLTSLIYPWLYNFPSTTCWRDCLFSIVYSCLLCQRLIDCRCVIISLCILLHRAIMRTNEVNYNFFLENFPAKVTKMTRCQEGAPWPPLHHWQEGVSGSRILGVYPVTISLSPSHGTLTVFPSPSKTMGTFILVDLSHHRKPKTISHPHTLLQTAFSCQTSEISLWIPLLPPLLIPTPEAFWLGPLEVTVICKIPYILNLFWNVLFLLLQFSLVIAFHFLKVIFFYFMVFCSTTAFTIPNS